jgi:hypothetical protein
LQIVARFFQRYASTNSIHEEQEEAMTNNKRMLNSESLQPDESSIDPILANHGDPYAPPELVEPMRPNDNSEEPARATDTSGVLQDETYGNEQAQRMRDAEKGRQSAEWIGTDPG